MVNTQELILGAKLRSKSHNGLIVDVVGLYLNAIVISANPIAMYGPEDFDPIEITPDILEKAGFKKDGFNQHSINIAPHPEWSYRVLYKTSDYLYLREGKGEHASMKDDMVVLWNKDLNPKLYLHQLQALYLFLTGKQLNIEL